MFSDRTPSLIYLRPIMQRLLANGCPELPELTRLGSPRLAKPLRRDGLENVIMCIVPAACELVDAVPFPKP
jgi:hypothetical protein